MSKEKTTSKSGKRKRENASAPNADTHLAAGGELHQIAGGGHPALTTNQGVALADNQNSLRASPCGPALLEDCILRKKSPISLTPESMHTVMWIVSDRTIPRSLRMIEGFGVHSFRLINDAGKSTFVKFH